MKIFCDLTDKGLYWGHIKQKLFRQIYIYSRIFRNYSGIFRYAGPCVTLVYSEPQVCVNIVSYLISAINKFIDR